MTQEEPHTTIRWVCPGCDKGHARRVSLRWSSDETVVYCDEGGCGRMFVLQWERKIFFKLLRVEQPTDLGFEGDSP